MVLGAGILFLVVGDAAFAQTSYWQVYGANEGLSQQTAQAFHQDSKGYLWVGTRAGLNRFDGERFVSYGVRHGLENDWINDITEDASGAIWIGTNNGLSRWTPEDGFVNYDVEGGLPGKTVSAVAPDGEGGIWAGTGSGLARWDGSEWRRYDTRHGLPPVAITALARGADGALFVATATGLYSRQGSTFREVIPSMLGGRQIFGVDVDREGTVWVSHGPRILGLVDGEVVSKVSAPSGSVFLTLVACDDGSLFARTSQDLTLVQDGEVQHLTTTQGVPMLTVISVFQDDEGILWIGGVGGIAKLVGRSFANYTIADGLGSNTVWQIARHDDDLWVATTGGLSRQSNGTWQTYTTADGLLANFVRGMHVDASGTMWVATQAGLNRRVGDRFVPVQEARAAGEIFWIEEDPEGTLWLGSRLQGLVRGKDGQFEPVEVPGQRFSQARILITREGSVWASGDYGLSRWNGSTWKTYTRADGLSANEPYFMAEDSDDNIWFGYHSSHGVTRFDGNRFTSFTSADGLSNDAVYSVGADFDGNVWFGTASGLDRFDGQRFVSFGIDDGFVGSESNAGGFFADRDGTLWFGAIGGLSHYDPHHDLSYGPPPRVDVTALKFGDAEGQAPFDNRNLTARVAALSNVNRNQLELRYRLQNHGGGLLPSFLGETKAPAEWRMLSGPEIVFNNLSAGDYTLEVQGRKYSGPWSGSGQASFKIAPPFWQRWWFVLLVGVGIACTARGLLTWQLRRVQFKNEVLQDNIRRLQEADRIKNEFLSNMSHEIRTPIAGILGFADILKDETDSEHREFVELIEFSAKRLQRTLDSVLDLAQLSSDKLQIELSAVDVGQEARAALMAMQPAAEEKRLQLTFENKAESSLAMAHLGHLGRVLDILVFNAIKFTEAGSITVSVTSDEDHVVIQVRDSGIGIDESFLQDLFEPFVQGSTGASRTHEGNGLGLAITKRLIDLMGGEIGVESQVGVGSTFTVRLERYRAARQERGAVPRGDESRWRSTRRQRLKTFARK